MEADVLIIGSGAAGLTAALQLATSRKVVVLAKGSISDGATAWAQGGIIYFGKKDSPASLVRDVLQAGAGLCNPEAVRLLADNKVVPDFEAEPNGTLINLVTTALPMVLIVVLFVSCRNVFKRRLIGLLVVCCRHIQRI
jgi:hypothetical protein